MGQNLTAAVDPYVQGSNLFEPFLTLHLSGMPMEREIVCRASRQGKDQFIILYLCSQAKPLVAFDPSVLLLPTYARNGRNLSNEPNAPGLVRLSEEEDAGPD